MDRDKIVSSIKERLGINSDDRAADIPDELILFEYANARATYIEQIYSKGGRYNDSDLVQFVKMPMTRVNNTACPNISGRCTIYRSVEKLPSDLIYVHGRQLLLHVGTPSVTGKGFFIVDYSRVRNVVNTERIVTNTVMAFVLDGYIYVFGENNPIFGALETTMVMGIFSDPDAVMSSGLCAENCNDYPIKPQYHTYILELLIPQLLPLVQSPRDNINDADGTVYQMTPQKSSKK